jgi:CubicO group peptidase (beta-lactamase class C family)
VANATGTWLPDFFQMNYAEPLDIHTYHMNLMPSGQAYMAGGISIRPRDELKLGQLYLDGGVWNGRRVVSKDWVTASTQKHSRFPDHDYGYAWHLLDAKVGEHVYREYEAGGNGGQFVIVVPELDLVVGITAGNYGDFRTWYAFKDLVAKYVIPAATQP